MPYTIEELQTLNFYNTFRDTNKFPLPVTDSVFPELMTLPLHPDVSFSDVDYSDTNANGICDEVGDWSSRCPNNTNSCKNAVVVEAGYKASNITFPADTPEIDFIEEDTTKISKNKGNPNPIVEELACAAAATT